MNKLGITVFVVMVVSKIRSLAIVITVKLARILIYVPNAIGREIIIINF